MEDKFRLIMGKLGEIDGLLNEKSSGWKTTRMSKVDLTILRLAVYEIRFDEDVPTGVAINEAVELAKRFGQDESASFCERYSGSRRAGVVYGTEYLFCKAGQYLY